MSDTASTSDTAQTSQDTREVVRERTSGEDRLTVYRDGDSYIAEYEGITFPETSWTKTHSAILSPDEVERWDKLWAIPENWIRKGAIKKPTIEGDYIFYSIPGDYHWVVVESPGRRHPIDSYYWVKDIGEIDHVYSVDCDKADLEDLVENKSDQFSEDILEGCRSLLNNWKEFRSLRSAEIADAGVDTLRCTPDSGYMEPRFDVRLDNSSTSKIVHSAARVNRKTADEIAELLHEHEVMNPNPTIEIKLY